MIGGVGREGAIDPIDYSVPGALTALDRVPEEVLDTGLTPVEICWPVHSLVIQPGDAEEFGLPAERFEENQLRPAVLLVERLLTMDASSLRHPRPPARRVIGTCRHFALLACALLRRRGTASRVRCGFATYFQPDLGLDHWVIEYRSQSDRNWVRLDPEILGQGILEHPEELSPGQFLTGGEAWIAFRRGEIDADRFGVAGTENWGPGEIRGNLVKDLAALNKIEMLPWDEWGRMEEGYQGTAGAAYDELLDIAAEATVADDAVALAELSMHTDLRVPDELIH